MARETPEWVKEAQEAYDDLETGGKFVFWWLSTLVVGVIFAIIFFSVVWSAWVGIIALIIVAVCITIGCLVYLEENM